MRRCRSDPAPATKDTIMTDRVTETSRFLSCVLRHAPEAIGIALHREGWVEIDALIAAAKNGRASSRTLV